MNKKLIQILFTYFWQDISAEECKNFVRIPGKTFDSRKDIINYAKSEVDNHVDIFESLPYDFQVFKI
jgi:hypothetical protein